jgi:hypothetical protein
LRDVDPEFEQFPVDPRCTPTWVGLRHLPDELTDLQGNDWSPHTAPTAFPGPVQPEAFSVPSDNGLGFDDSEHLGPVFPYPGEQDPEESVALFQKKTFDRTLQDSDLLPQCEILEGQLSLGCQGGNQSSEQRWDHEGYRGSDRVKPQRVQRGRGF